MIIMKHSAIFSLQASLTALSLKPPIELRRKSGAQKETMRQNMRHDENPLQLLGWPLGEVEARSVGGFMRVLGEEKAVEDDRPDRSSGSGGSGRICHLSLGLKP